MALHAPKTFNKAKLLGTFENGSPEWHEARADGIGGSEVGTILGLNPWESPFYLWASKTDNIPPKVLDSFAVKLGNYLEPVILDTILPDQHPDWEIFRTGTYQHPTIPYLHANPDALAKVDGEWVVVEVKTSRNYWSEVPPAYRAQVMHYMNIMGIKRGVVIGLVGMDWVEHWVEFDEFESQVIEQKCAEFWKLVIDNEQPSYDGSESTYEAVREMHPDIDGTEVEIDGAHYLTLAQSKFDEAEAELRLAKSEVLAKMGTAQHCYIDYQGEKIRVASRQSRKGSRPFLIVHKAKG
jgi:putative phage-type endonuclease